jgi:hypothetical protein
VTTFLSVTGLGTSWGCATRTTTGVKMLSFEAGTTTAVHDEYVLEAARRAIREGNRAIILSAERPVLVKLPSRVPLTPMGNPGGWIVQEAPTADDPTAPAPPEGTTAPVYGCRAGCDRQFPHPAPRARHEQVEHGVEG